MIPTERLKEIAEGCDPLTPAFITSTSAAPDYYVTIKSPTLKESQAWHDAVLALAKASPQSIASQTALRAAPAGNELVERLLEEAAYLERQNASPLSTATSLRDAANALSSIRLQALEEAAKWHDAQAERLQTGADLDVGLTNNARDGFRRDAANHRRSAAAIRALAQEKV